MYLNLDLLKRFNANPLYIQWFERHFKDDATLEQIIRAKKVPVDFLYWLKRNFSFSATDVAAYEEALNIVNSTHIFESENVIESDIVTNSKDISNGRGISYSQNVKSGFGIVHSKIVENSTTVFNGTKIYDSSKVVNSTNIKNSINISCSSYVLDSSDIYDGSLITNSSFIFNSKNLQNCYFLAGCESCVDSLFCVNQQKLKYGLFNHEIEETQWNFLREDLLCTMEARHLKLFDPWDIEDTTPSTRMYLFPNKYFEGCLDEELINWIKNLPYYDSMIAYQLTFNPVFLENKDE